MLLLSVAAAAAISGRGGWLSGSSVQANGHSQVELAGKWPFGLDAVFAAHVEIYPQRCGAFAFQAVDVGGVKVRTALHADELSPEHFDFRVELDNCLVTIDFHDFFHGFTPSEG